MGVALAACGEAPPAAPDVPLPERGVVALGVEGDVRRIAHPFGVTETPFYPRRIVSLGGADELLLLGVRPVAHTLFFGDFREYLRPHLEGVMPIGTAYGGFQPDVEAIYRARPDLILAGPFSGIGYDQLRRIAPTVPLTPMRPLADWERTLDSLHQVAAVLGREERARTVEAAFRRKAAKARELLYARGRQHETVATVRVHARRFRMNGRPQGGGPILYDLLGLRAPDVIRTNHWAKRAPLLMLTPEKMLGLEIEHLFVIVDPTLGNDNAMRAMEENAVWQRIPAVRRGHVYRVHFGAWQGGDLLGQEQIIDDVVTALTGETLPRILDGDVE
ncbi:MAG: ABC transporter substrate-binding protein [Planctomycetota bacterium]